MEAVPVPEAGESVGETKGDGMAVERVRGGTSGASEDDSLGEEEEEESEANEDEGLLVTGMGLETEEDCEGCLDPLLASLVLGVATALAEESFLESAVAGEKGIQLYF